MDLNEDLWQLKRYLFIFLMMPFTQFFCASRYQTHCTYEGDPPPPPSFKYKDFRRTDMCIIIKWVKIFSKGNCHSPNFCDLVRCQLTETPPGSPAGCSVVCAAGMTTRILLAKQQALGLFPNCGLPTRLLICFKSWPLILERYQGI